MEKKTKNTYYKMRKIDYATFYTNDNHISCIVENKRYGCDDYWQEEYVDYRISVRSTRIA